MSYFNAVILNYIKAWRASISVDMQRWTTQIEFKSTS